MNNTRRWFRCIALLLPFVASCAPTDGADPAEAEDDRTGAAVSELNLQPFDLCSPLSPPPLGAFARAQIDEIGPSVVEPGGVTILRGRNLDQLPPGMRAAYYSGTTRIATSTRVYSMGPTAVLVMAPRAVPAGGTGVSVQLEYAQLCPVRSGVGGVLGGSTVLYTERSITLVRSPATSSFERLRFVRLTGGVMPAPALSARTLGPNGVELTWTDPGSDESGFRIDYRHVGRPEWLTVGAVPANRTREPIPGLRQATGYEFRVVPYDRDRDGTPSNTASTTTTVIGANSAVVTVHRSFSSAGGIAPLAGTLAQPVTRTAVAYYDANGNGRVDGASGWGTFPFEGYPTFPSPSQDAGVPDAGIRDGGFTDVGLVGPGAQGSSAGNLFSSAANLVVMVEFDRTAGGQAGVNQFAAFHIQVNGAVATVRRAVGGDYASGRGMRGQTMAGSTLTDYVQIAQFVPPSGGVNGRVRGSVRAYDMAMSEQLAPGVSSQHYSDVQADFDLEVLAR